MPGPSHKLIVTNQVVGAPFVAWLRELADSIGSVELWSGSVVEAISPNVSAWQGPAYNRKTVYSRLSTWVAFTLASAWRLLRRGRRMPLFVVTNPPMMPLVVWLLARFCGNRYGVLEWDIYPDVIAAMGYIKPAHPLYRLWNRLHGLVLRDADLVVTIGARMASLLEDAAHTSGSIVTIPNWVDTEWIKPCSRDRNVFLRNTGLEDKFIVLYSGNLGATHAIEVIVAVAELLKDDDRIHFLFIGEGSKRALVEQAIEFGNQANLTLLERQPETLLPYVLASADVGIVTLARGFENLSLPSKTYGLMAAGCVLLGISHPPNDLAGTIIDYECGANFTADEPARIAEWIRTLARHPECQVELSHNARSAAVQHFSKECCQPLLTEVVCRHLMAR